MALTYNFGQFRKSQTSNYTTPLNYDKDNPIVNFVNIAEYSNNKTQFFDKRIDLRGTGTLFQPLDSTRINARNFFIRFKVYKRMDSVQDIKVQLKYIDSNENDPELAIPKQDITQRIENISVPIGREEEYVTFDLVISPNATYNSIEFILQRLPEDFDVNTKDGEIYGRKMHIELVYLEEIQNIITNNLNTSIGETGVLKQIGVQSSPGLLMCIDGEAIRVGRSGIYEINNGISIGFLGFIIHNDGENNPDDRYFILDYQY